MIETRPRKTQERALLIGLEKKGVSKWDLRDSLDELRELANSAGAEVVDTVTQKLPKPTAPYYIGRGKAESIKESCQDQRVTSVIFDDELSPAQGRNLENLFARKVLDRTQLILDIFAQRARSREGRLQIELAQLQYLLPRLTRMWHHLSRQTGGIGSRDWSVSWKLCVRPARYSAKVANDVNGQWLLWLATRMPANRRF